MNRCTNCYYRKRPYGVICSKGKRHISGSLRKCPAYLQNELVTFNEILKEAENQPREERARAIREALQWIELVYGMVIPEPQR